MLRLLVAVGVLGAAAGCACGDDDDDAAGLDAGPDATGDGDADGDGDGDGDADAGSDAGADAGADAGPEPDPSDAVFSLEVLHEVELEIDTDLFWQMDLDHENRVPATLTYDGVRLDEIGVREKCGIGSCTTIADKAGFSIKFDEFVADQELFGLRRLVLNNSIQDPSYSNELLGQELARRSGIPYKRVAYANVTLNGDDYGLFVVVEAVDKRFLRRHFGEAEEEGNLYEGECCGDFVWDPWFPELKDEVEENRVRDDIIALADFVATADDAAFIAGVDARMDFAGYLTGYAISALTYHWDGYEYNTNNYYMFDRPSDGRFVFWLHGMDQLFYDCGWSIDAMGRGRIGQRVLENPALRDDFRAEITRFLDDVWDEAELVQLVDDARAIYEDAARADPRHPLDENRLRDVRHCLIDRPDNVRAQLAAICGNGVLEAGEQCDDGGVEPRDGCSATCRSECGNGQLDGSEQCDDGNPWDGDGCSALCTFEPGCGDSLVQAELLEDCDDGANGESFADGCRDDCSANACGDGRLDLGEECDDGGLVAGDGCDPGCFDEDGAATCGNGVLEAGEVCDDGGLVDGDGCDSSCTRPCGAGADASLVWGANQHCYELFWAGLDWWTAEATCEARAGHLVTVTRDGENRMLARLGPGWLGLSDEAEEGSFGWVTGEPYALDGLRPGEPNDWGGNEDCGVLEGIGWNDLDCAAAVSYFCEIE